MDPKIAWDIILAFAGGAGLLAGVVGLVVGAIGYEAYCPAGVGAATNCFMEGGEVFGVVYAGSPVKAAFLVGATFAAAAALIAGWYKEREQKRKASLA